MECTGDKVLREIVSKQIGRDAKNFCKVAVFCSHGFPQVIKSLPVRDGKPFPTLNYLTCPYLVKEVSRLEEKGMIKEVEKIIEEDEEFKEKLFQAHRKVIEERDSYFELDEISEFKQWREKLKNVGTGGISNFSKVKCLHLHLADFLVGIKNPVGKLVYERLGEIECKDKYCEGLK
ncbi:hypothetical protein SU69_00990 [Thermosipho melanesiensis]|uniref:DUF501 domain-containing protein n=2 Tax=Thermosipho melanesiensis TaxID=46541 RepID=A6LJG2_THEM4|nr:DUF501 domain-containing protein [Thermosipho melanesiensis]ABR30063.1 protein of unknown function DUF501 [Thermosipho melanesiensis BI429]APT73260.1 hypothetical protein BW47_01020 [Thermosipho melanesiensis]OOC38656.1 hypothetical protein SU68_00990 [Thermosipho melanesiensis]OOC40460.1 hypothetical protein SU70_00990 [Thermosipho melanesiensis]OOC40725.1 hypothetical protein SU69_00990 [Thermosipho melanesiensis]